MLWIQIFLSDVWDEEIVIIVNDMKRILLYYLFICVIELKTCRSTIRLNWNEIEYINVGNYLCLSWKGIFRVYMREIKAFTEDINIKQYTIV